MENRRQITADKYFDRKYFIKKQAAIEKSISNLVKSIKLCIIKDNLVNLAQNIYI